MPESRGPSRIRRGSRWRPRGRGTDGRQDLVEIEGPRAGADAKYWRTYGVGLERTWFASAAAGPDLRTSRDNQQVVHRTFELHERITPQYTGPSNFTTKLPSYTPD